MTTINHNIEPYVLIEEISDTDFYIGTCNNGNNPAMSFWKIKKIWKEDNIIKFGYPDRDQSFSFSWNDRGKYNYK